MVGSRQTETNVKTKKKTGQRTNEKVSKRRSKSASETKKEQKDKTKGEVITSRKGIANVSGEFYSKLFAGDQCDEKIQEPDKTKMRTSEEDKRRR